jgi:hypothetical protein
MPHERIRVSSHISHIVFSLSNIDSLFVNFDPKKLSLCAVTSYFQYW